MQQVTVRVPASTSNLGPGFDSLGVALRIYNHVTISRRGRGKANGVVLSAATAFFETTKTKPFLFTCSIEENVPRSRGLGSSATVRLGLIHGLNELSGRPLQRCEMFELCARLEGHPDNAAPAEYGGFNVVRGATRQTFSISERVHFVLLIPAFEIKTRSARALLPIRVERLAAVETCQNACTLTAAFAAREYEKLRGAFVDHLHQPFRKKMIPFFDDTVAAAEAAGALGAFLSGSGSSICAITLHSGEKVARAMLAAAKSRDARTVIALADNRGARLLATQNR